MMDRTRDAFTAMANEIAKQRETNLSRLQKELLEIEAKKLELERSIKSVRLARQRLHDYGAIFGSDFPCPRCWIDYEARNPMSSRPSDTRDDIWQCDHCGLTITV